MAQIVALPASRRTTTAERLRMALLGLVGFSALGLALELAVERHWTQPIQLVAWGAVLALAITVGLIFRARSVARVRAAQILAAAVVLCAALGTWEHIAANHDAGELDYRYGATWDQLPVTTQWWLALSKAVGPAPPFASGALAVAGLGALLATLDHPALARKARATTPEEERTARVANDRR
jgi:hypothetical protein